MSEIQKNASPNHQKMLTNVDPKTGLDPDRIWERFLTKKGTLDPPGLASRLGAVLKITYSQISHFSTENDEKVAKIISKRWQNPSEMTPKKQREKQVAF